MSKILILALTFIFPLLTYGVSLEGKYLSESGRYLKVVEMQCLADEAGYCIQVCGDERQCLLPEPLCLNCAGTAWGFLRSLFTQPQRLYVVDNEIFDMSLIVFEMMKDRTVLVDSKSVFNYYTALQSEALVSAMMQYCPLGTAKVQFALNLNAESIPTSLHFVNCQSVDGVDRYFSVRKAEAITQN